jgi:hypothetical protein
MTTYLLYIGYQLYMRIDILLTCENHFHDRIISLRGEVQVHKTCLIHQFIEVHEQSQESKMSLINTEV